MLTIIAIVIAAFVALCFGLGVAGIVGDNAAAGKMDAKVTSCSFTGGPLPSAKVGITVTNNGDATRTAAVKIEYRDAGGNRIDTDTAYVRDVRPGDTARHEEVTFLAAEISSGTCAIVGVD